MSTMPVLRELLELVVRETEIEKALAAIVRKVRDVTRSRNALIAILDDETGHLEITYGVGPDWTEDSEGRIMKVTVGNDQGITAFVAATGKSFVTGNVDEVPAYLRLFHSTKSEVAVPILDQHRKLKAVLNLESDIADYYSPEDVLIAETFGLIASMVLEKEDSWIREEALVEIGTAMDDAVSVEDVLHKVIDVAARVLHFQACSIFFFDPKSQQYVLRAATGALKDQVGEVSYKPGEGFTGWVCESGRPILLDHPQTDSRWRGKYTEFPNAEIASFLAVPIVIRGKSIGAIRALRRVPENQFLDNRFTETDLRIFEAIADQTAVALENIRSLEKLLHAERMGAWGELSAKSSHMIGNRVFALKGDVNEIGYLLSDHPEKVEELQGLHKSMETNVTRLQELLQDFRDFVTATQLNRAPHNLNELVKETLEEVFPKRTSIKLEQDFDSEIPNVNIDDKKLKLALSELIENAVTFLDGGVIHVSTGWADAGTIRKAKLSPTARFVQIVIADTGPGVEMDKKDVIFQPFYTGRVKGMGLGLSIVKGIVDAHGGTVIESGEFGKGARFVVLLPASERQNQGGI